MNLLRDKLARLRAMKEPERRAETDALDPAGNPDPALLLLRLLTERSGSLRGVALDRLREHGGWMARLAARACALDRWEINRGDAADMFGELPARRDMPWLETLAQDRRWPVRSSAALALSEIGGERAIWLLERLLSSDCHPAVFRDAALALAASHTSHRSQVSAGHDPSLTLPRDAAARPDIPSPAVWERGTEG